MRKIIIACILIGYSLMSFAQSNQFKEDIIDISKTKNPKQDLKKVLKSLAKKENLNLAYESNVLNRKFCNFNLEDLSITKALDLVLQSTGLEYKIINQNQLLIRRRIQNELENLNVFSKITDKNNNENLAYSSIYLSGSNIGSFADSLGRFHLTIPSNYKTSKKDTVIIHRIGYNDKKIELNSFINNSDIELEINTRVLPILTIVPKLKKIEVSHSVLGSTIDNSENKALTFASKDILRSLHFLPSVSANKDNSAKLRIRGSKTYETLVLLDGLRIYNPTHFYNVFSAINNDYVSKIYFYKNGIPPNIRSMTGGVVEMLSYPIIKDRISGNLDFNLMYLSGVINIPITKSIGINVAARKSMIENTKQSFFGDIISSNQPVIQDERLLNTRGDKTSPGFDFYDINAKLEWKITDNQNFSLNYYHSNDSYVDKFKKTFIVEKNHVNNTLFNFNYDNEAFWSNMGLGINYKIKWSRSLISKLAISSVNYREYNKLYLDIFRKVHNTNTNRTIDDNQESKIADNVFKLDNSFKVNNSNRIVFGVDITNYSVNSEIIVKNTSIFNSVNAFSSYTFYSGYYYKKKNWEFDASFQASHYTGTQKQYFDPSFSIKYNLNDKISFYANANRQHQYLREFEYETAQAKNTSIWALANGKNPILSTVNFSFGVNLKGENYSFMVELYNKKQNGLSILLLPRPGTRENSVPKKLDYKVFFGNGLINGLDVMWIQKIKNYRSQLSYSFSINNQQFKQLFRNEYYPSPDDSRHQIKWAQTYSLKQWELGVNLIYSSGTPYFDFSNIDKDKHRFEINYIDYIRSIPDYFRSDISLKYHLKIFKQEAKIGFSIFNLTNRANITNKQIVFRSQSSNPSNNPKHIESQANLLGRTINLGINIDI